MKLFWKLACLVLFLFACRFVASRYYSRCYERWLHEERRTIYLNPATTTPQLAWLQAAADGALREFGAMERRQWRSNVQFQSLVMGGKGDFWLGSVETLARARQAGAPVRILLVTGWRKWVLVGTDAADWRDALKCDIATAPPGNPAAAMLKALSPYVSMHYSEGRALVMQLLNGDVKTALIAEPLATEVLKKNPKLKRLGALEDIKAEIAGGEARVPWAAIAVNEKSSLFPKAGQIAEKLIAASRELEKTDVAQIVDLWPKEYCETISREQLAASLEQSPQDAFLALTGKDAADEIRAYLAIVAPDVVWDEKLIFGCD